MMTVSEEIQTKVAQAKEFRESGDLKQSKNKYLDAAQIALNYAKSVEDAVKKLSYENIARALIDEAKAMQEEIFLTQLPTARKGQIKKSSVNKAQDTLMVRKRPDVYSLWVIKAGGVPVISHDFMEMDGETEGKINEILFSGAITAINQLMFEALEKPIQTINFDTGVLIIQTYDDVNYVLFAESNSPGLNKALKQFYEKLEKSVAIPINSPKIIRDLTDDEVTQKLIEKIFPKNK